MKKLLIFLFITFLITSPVAAQETQCDNRYVTLVNPVRGRDLWIDKTINPLRKQYDLIKQYNFPATWLLQYDVLSDKDLLDEINKFDGNQEKGVFLEVSKIFAEAARIIYPHDVPWYSPKAVFLSAYTQSDRRKLIDKLLKTFKDHFGYYPKSIGAWWIDSYSLKYLKEKYKITSALIVADQKTTDNYGVWGQWWGVPYYPSKANILTPASNLKNRQDVVVIQWAQRDPLQAFGYGSKYSNYSLQANDYTERGKDSTYFNDLVETYLDCKNAVGQITVGLETGIESVKSLDEYNNQLISLQKKKKLEFVTMSDFAKQFANIYPDFPKQVVVSSWILTPNERFNKPLGEIIHYNQDISFADYFTSDKTNFLDRNLQSKNQQKNTRWFPWFLFVCLGLLLFSYFNKLVKIWGISILFALSAFGLILRSYYQMGWKVFFGPQLPYLESFQTILIIVSFGIFWLIHKRRWVWILPLIFGFDFLLQSIRISYFSDRYYFGFAIDALRFIGVSIKGVSDINFINQDFPSYISAAFLKVNFGFLWDNPFIAIIIYPFVHILIGIILSLLVIRLPDKIQKLVLVVLIVLFLLQLNNIFTADPRQVVPILLQ